MSKIEVRLNPDVTPAGSDLSIVNAARRSFNTRSEWEKVLEPQAVYEVLRLKPKDKRLLEFLARGMTSDDFHDFVLSVGDNGVDWLYWLDDKVKNKLIKLLWQWRNTPTHDTPFNHTFISFEVKAPIFVRAQLVKHEYLIMSEFSRRYITDDVEFYEPDYWRKAAPNKKQGSLEEAVDISAEYVWCDDNEPKYGWDDYTLHELYGEHEERVLILFQKMVERGVAPEQARMVLPQSTMTEWTWSGTLGAFAKMCTLRLHPEAQYEARIVAKEVYKHLQEYYPVAAKALVEGPDT